MTPFRCPFAATHGKAWESREPPGGTGDSRRGGGWRAGGIFSLGSSPRTGAFFFVRRRSEDASRLVLLVLPSERGVGRRQLLAVPLRRVLPRLRTLALVVLPVPGIVPQKKGSALALERVETQGEGGALPHCARLRRGRRGRRGRRLGVLLLLRILLLHVRRQQLQQLLPLRGHRGRDQPPAWRPDLGTRNQRDDMCVGRQDCIISLVAQAPRSGGTRQRH